MDFEGVVIRESLESSALLDTLDIVSTSVEPVTDHHMTPWLTQWTMHTVRVPESDAALIAEALSHAIDSAHSGSWYADFKNDALHYVIYRDIVFLVDRRDARQYQAAVDYGVSCGLPPHQADFVALVE